MTLSSCHLRVQHKSFRVIMDSTSHQSLLGYQERLKSWIFVQSFGTSFYLACGSIGFSAHFQNFIISSAIFGKHRAQFHTQKGIRLVAAIADGQVLPTLPSRWYYQSLALRVHSRRKESFGCWRTNVNYQRRTILLLLFIHRHVHHKLHNLLRHSSIPFVISPDPPLHEP